MSKLDDVQKKAKKILEDIEGNSSSTQINVETSTQSTSVSGGTTSDDQVEKIEELTGDLQRLQAEFANYKRRAESERAEVIDFAKTRVVREFLTVRDSFDQELLHRPADIDAAWASSIDAIRSQFDKVLSGLGVERFESEGNPFDPNFHEAIATDGTGDVVTEELAPGYKLGNNILRHAMVKVGSSLHEDEPAAQENPPAEAQ